MKSGLPQATDTQKRRFRIIKEEIGCIVCLNFGQFAPAHAHHLIDPKTGNRISHDATIPLCDPHHVGTDLSTHKHKKKFATLFGTDEALLAVTNQLVDEYEVNTIGRAV